MIVNLRENMERNELREGTIAIAADRDKTSCQALKWAVDRYIPQGGTIKIVHVIQRSPLNANGPHTDDEMSERQHNDKRDIQFLTMRCLCVRRNIQTEVVLLEDQDVAKALIEYISQNRISTFLLGASLKKSITRLFKVDDIPSNVMRWAPDFCNVLIISKGRLQSVRSATRSLPQTMPSPTGTGPFSPRSNSTTTTDEAPSEMLLSREDDALFQEFSSLGTYSKVNISGRMSTESSGISFYKKLGAPPMLEIPRFSVFDDENSKLSIYLNSPSEEKNYTLASPVSPMDDVQVEMQRLKKELKDTMNMYHAACKEALIEKEKAAELEIWKRKAEKRLQMAEERATMAIMEIEKTKTKVQKRVKASTKEVRGRRNDDRKMDLNTLEVSHMVIEYVSFLHILVVLLLLYFYFTFR